MKRAIWKFPLTPTGTAGIEVEMPIGAEILCVQMQYDNPCLWAVVDIEAEKETKSFTVLGTGHSFTTHPGVYVGTCQLSNGGLVFHIFEK